MTITISDEENYSINATIWGEGCKDSKYVEGCIIAVKGARVSDYGGKSLNIGDGCIIEFDPQNVERYQDIKNWYESQNGKIQTTALTSMGDGGPGWD